jgi:hypothetical protein
MQSKITKNRGTSFKEFYFIYNNKVAVATRDEILQGKLVTLLKTLKPESK